MDLSKLSDADLAAIAAGDMGKVSTEGLTLITAQGPTTAPKTEPMQTPTPQAERSPVGSLARAVGLFARSGAEGLADTADFFTEPVRLGLNKVLPSAIGPVKPLGKTVPAMLDSWGFPKPETAMERVVHETNKVLSGTGGMARSAAALAGKTTGALGNVFTALASNPTQQVTSAAGAGLGGGAVKEQGGGPLSQIGGALLGGVAGGLLPGVASSVTTGGKRLAQSVASEFGLGYRAEQVDGLISKALSQAGVDYAQIPERVRQSMRADIQAALHTGQPLDPSAVSRLLDYRRIGATPTVGGITQNPVEVTKEMNLAKTAVNTGDTSLHGLARVQNENNKTLIRNINEAGALPTDLYDPSVLATKAIKTLDDTKRTRVTELYDAARSMTGGDIALERKPFVDNIYGALIKENKLNFLPESVSNMLNTISKGQITRDGQVFPVPFTADTLDTLMTVLATEQRATSNGNVKHALKLARAALDNTELVPLKNMVGGNTVVDQGTANVLRHFDQQPEEYMKALNTARAAARERFNWQESARPIEDALKGVTPDSFLKKHLLSEAGTLEDAKAIAAHADTKAVRDAILLHLKTQALGGAADDVGKFSQSNYNKALRSLGDRKLSLFFEPDELEHLKTIGRVASYVQTQPVGSAVNNSNSAAMLLGRMYDGLRAGMSHIVGVGPVAAGAIDAVLGNPARRTASWAGSRDAQNLARAVVSQPQTASRAASLLIPAAAAIAGPATE